MFGIRRMLLSCGVATTLLLSLTPAFAADTVPPAKPMDPGSPDVLAVVTIPNFNSLCDHAEALGKAFNPAAVQPGMIKGLLSQKFTEPVLASIDGSKPITALILPPAPGAVDGGMVDMVFFIPAKTGDALAPMVKEAKGEMAFQDGVIITSQTAAGVERGKTLLANYKKLEADNIASDARIFVNAALVNKMFGPILQMLAAGGLEKIKKETAQAAGPFPPEMIQKLAVLYIKSALGLLNQSTAIQLDLSFDGDRIKSDTLFQAKPGSTLAGLFSAPEAYEGKTGIILAPEAAMRGFYRMNPQAISAFGEALAAEIGADPELKDLKESEVLEVFKKSSALMGTEGSMSIGANKDGGMEIVQALEVPDEAKYFAMLDEMHDLFGAEGEIGKFYAKLGMKMEMTLTKNVRQHGGVQVHASKTTIESKLPQQQALLNKIPTAMEISGLKGVMITSSNPTTLDSLIDKTTAGLTVAEAALPLEAIKTFGLGQSAYFDLDFIAYMKMVSGMDPNLAMLKPVLDKLKPGAPMTFSGNYGDGRFLLKQNIPLAPLIEFTTSMQQMIQQMQPPPPPPPPPAGDGKKPVPETF